MLWHGKALTDWYSPSVASDGNNGGGLDTSAQNGSGQSTLIPCHSLGLCVQLTTTYPYTGETPAARLFRWRESRANRSAYYSAWLFIPLNYVETGNPSTGQYWNLMQFKSTQQGRPSSASDPVWAFEIVNDAGGGLTFRGVWASAMKVGGPRRGDGVGWKGYPLLTPMKVPIASWFKVTAFLTESKDFDGVFRVWVNDTLVLDFSGVRTSYSSCTYNAWCADDEWSVNLYSDGLFPSPANLYVDDAEIRSP